MNYSLAQKIPKAATPVKAQAAHAANTHAKTPPQVANTQVNTQAKTPPQVAKTPTKTGGKAAPKKYEGKKYTEEDIQELLSDGYIGIHPSLWDYIPAGAHIRYVKKDVTKEGLARADRFKPGGFVRNHFTTDEGKKMMMIETKRGGRQGDAGYISFPVAYEDVEELWKKYDHNAFIEVHLIYTSLAQKKKQIEDLDARVKKLEAALKR